MTTVAKSETAPTTHYPPKPSVRFSSTQLNVETSGLQLFVFFERKKTTTNSNSGTQLTVNRVIITHVLSIFLDKREKETLNLQAAAIQYSPKFILESCFRLCFPSTEAAEDKLQVSNTPLLI